MKRIVFFNQYHNGDCFVPKGYIRDIVSQLPEIEFHYAHRNHPSIVADLPLQYMPLEDMTALDHQVRVAESSDKQTMYINTWVGCWQGALFNYGEHINYQRLHEIWRRYYQHLGLKFSEDRDRYLPDMDWTRIDNLTQAQAAMRELGDQGWSLFCNGPANSGQSRMGDMRNIVADLAQRLPEHTLVCTQRLEGLDLPNVRYTSDLLGNLDSDINLIAYMSRGARIIVGKNSGPFSYCCNRENLLNPRLTFLSFSTRLTDCLNGGSLYPARHAFADSIDDVACANIVHRLITQRLHGTEYITV